MRSQNFSIQTFNLKSFRSQILITRFTKANTKENNDSHSHKYQLVEGANTMLRVAKEVLAAQTTRQVTRLLLEDGNHVDQDEDPA
jgi:hypothetical protein